MSDAKNYFRVADQYYEWVYMPRDRRTFIKRKRSAILDDHGLDFLRAIPRYGAFCNVPDHINYQEGIDECLNLYCPLSIGPEELKPGPWSYTFELLNHIFGPKIELGLDYIQLLYKEPTQILPILYLFSKENSTGKSTFAKWLKAIFDQNMAMVGSFELELDYNGSYVAKLLVCLEDSYIGERVFEKIKALSTSDRVGLYMKRIDLQEIDFFGKFLVLSNDEHGVIRNNLEDDIRFWVLKVPPIRKKNPDLLAQMIYEIPSFLHFLNHRALSTEKEDRAWFNPDLLKPGQTMKDKVLDSLSE